MSIADTLFFESALGAFDVGLMVYAPEIARFDDYLGPYTQVDLADNEPNDWELGVPFLPAMDEVRVESARLDLRGLRVAVPAEGWSAVPQSSGWRITLAQPARLVSIAFDPPTPDPPLAPGETLRLLISSADPPGPPAFIDPAFSLGNAYAAIRSRISQRTEGGSTVATLDATFGSSWLLQFGVGNDAQSLNVRAATTTVRAVTIERAVSDARLELRPDESGGEPVLVWNHPGALDPGAGLQPVDMSPIARKRLNDRLAAGNSAQVAPTALTLPLRLVATIGGPVGVSGTEVRVDYAVDAAAGGAQLALRGEQERVVLSVPAALRPASGTLKLDAKHLGRELNGPVGPVPPTGGPGVLVSVGHWVAVALPVAAIGSAATVTLASVTLDLSADAPAEVAVDVTGDVHGLPGAALASAVVQLDPGPRAVRELLFDAPPAVAAGAVVWVAARATTGAVRWYADVPEQRPAALAVDGPVVRTSNDEGATWVPDDQRLGGATTPRARLLHRVEPPYAAPVLTLRAGDAIVATMTLPATGAASDEFAVAAEPLAAGLADLAGRTTGSGRTDLAVYAAVQAALDLRIGRVDFVYPPTAGPTPLEGQR